MIARGQPHVSTTVTLATADDSWNSLEFDSSDFTSHIRPYSLRLYIETSTLSTATVRVALTEDATGDILLTNPEVESTQQIGASPSAGKYAVVFPFPGIYIYLPDQTLVIWIKVEDAGEELTNVTGTLVWGD